MATAGSDRVQRPGRPPKGSSLGLLPLSLFLASFLCSCSILESDDPEIRLVNATGSPVAVLAWEREASDLLDPAPSIDLSDSDAPVLASGATRVLRLGEIEGGFSIGDDLRLFLYQVTGNVAELRDVRTLLAEELREIGFRVVLDGF